MSKLMEIDPYQNLNNSIKTSKAISSLKYHCYQEPSPVCHAIIMPNTDQNY